MLTVRLDSPVPLADQLVAGLRGAIARGEVSPGGRLPTVRQLAADLGVHMNTVARAYRALESQGLVSTVRGRGTQVTSATERSGRAAQPAQLAAQLAGSLADARLAGLSRQETETLVDEALDALWPQPTTGQADSPHDGPAPGPPTDGAPPQEAG
ncbi:MAG: GntR family transcriptional regulator [Planctomycetota bacterium]|nr:MAG: GntR family transcriptional regulator [Planctomycetota bacterium]